MSQAKRSRELDRSTARVEPMAVDEPLVWKYRGQVIPRNETVRVEVEVTETGTDPSAFLAMLSSRLFLEGNNCGVSGMVPSITL